jgi:GIY-YIG catalytic domain
MALQLGQWHEFSQVTIHQVPSEPGVYFFRSRGGTKVYIGKSDRSLRDRLQQHLRCIEIVQELSGIPTSWELRFIVSRNPRALEYVALRGYVDRVNALETGNAAYREVEQQAGVRP